MLFMRRWTNHNLKNAEVKRAKVTKTDAERVDTRKRYIQFRYTDTGEIGVIDVDDPDTFDKMFDSGRPVEVMCYNRTID